MSYDKEQATREFEKWSDSYDRCILQRMLFAPSHRAILKKIGERKSRDESFRVLDVGCGTGIFAERIRQAFPKATVWGVDLVVGMLSQGNDRWRRHSTSIQAVQGDSERLPFDAETFDYVTCANSFHHYPHQDRAIAEMRRVLKPGGGLLLIDGYRDGLWGWFIYDVCVATVEGAVHHASGKRLRDLCERAGFASVVQKVHRGLAPFLLTQAIAPSPTEDSGIFREEASANDRNAQMVGS